MRYRFIDKQKKAWPVTLLYGVLHVSRSGYYDWTARSLSGRRRLNTELDRRICTIFAEHRQRYGGNHASPKPYAMRATGTMRTALLVEGVRWG
jgi:hypothetical protein